MIENGEIDMECEKIAAGKKFVVKSLKAVAVNQNLPIPIVNWQSQYFRNNTIYTALIFIGDKQTRLSFLDQELSSLMDTEHPTLIQSRIYNVLAAQ